MTTNLTTTPSTTATLAQPTPTSAVAQADYTLGPAAQDAAAASVGGGSLVVIRNLQDQPHRWRGVLRPGDIAEGHHADVIPGVLVRIFGLDTNRCDGPAYYDKTFKIGDIAEYGSYNLHYFGKIVAIGRKTVAIDTGCSQRVRKLRFYEFSWRNRGDRLRKLHINANWMD